MSSLSDLQKAAYFPANSNLLGYFIRDLATAGWRCARCQGVVITEAEVHAARDPEALAFLVKQAERRHKTEAHSGR